jgi:hypothetical protein
MLRTSWIQNGSRNLRISNRANRNPDNNNRQDKTALAVSYASRTSPSLLCRCCAFALAYAIILPEPGAPQHQHAFTYSANSRKRLPLMRLRVGKGDVRKRLCRNLYQGNMFSPF